MFVFSYFLFLNPNVTTTHACYLEINRAPIEVTSMNDDSLVQPMVNGCAGYEMFQYIKSEYGFAGDSNLNLWPSGGGLGWRTVVNKMPIPSSSAVHGTSQSYYYSDGTMTVYVDGSYGRHAVSWLKAGASNYTYKFRGLDDTLPPGNTYYPW